MIGWIEGQIKNVYEDHAIVSCKGLGYEVFLSSRSIAKIQTEIGSTRSFHIFTHVREDQLQLFGFEEFEEKSLFTLLKSVGGIGAKTAMNMLSKLPYPDMVAAITSKNASLLSSCPGIGKKTAERVIIDLSDKLKNVSMPMASARVDAAWRDELLSALSNLGYKPDESEKAIADLNMAEDAPFETVLRASLKNLRR